MPCNRCSVSKAAACLPAYLHGVAHDSRWLRPLPPSPPCTYVQAGSAGRGGAPGQGHVRVQTGVCRPACADQRVQTRLRVQTGVCRPACADQAFMGLVDRPCTRCTPLSFAHPRSSSRLACVCAPNTLIGVALASRAAAPPALRCGDQGCGPRVCAVLVGWAPPIAPSFFGSAVWPARHAPQVRRRRLPAGVRPFQVGVEVEFGI